MHFSKRLRSMSVVWAGLCCLSLGMVAGCKDNTTEQNEVFADAKERVKTRVLPELTRESQAVLRNMVNVLTIFPEVCATPLAGIGNFTSQTIGKPNITPGDEDGEWIFTWSNVVLGDDDLTTVNADAAPVNVTMAVIFRAQNDDPLRAIPFSLAPQTALQTVGEPPSFVTGTTARFFLYQNGTTGAWILRWRAGGEDKIFAGVLTASGGVSRLIRRVEGSAGSVSSLVIGENTQEVTFSEPTIAGNEKGFTFHARPGDVIRLRLRLGASDSTLSAITRDDLRIGAEDDPLPDNKDPEDFFLASSVPLNPTGEPPIVPGTSRGTFLWQEDVTTSGCLPGQDQWRLRFTTPNSSEIFSGELVGEADETAVAVAVNFTPVAPCSGNASSYTCTLGNGQLGGYDVCVSPAGARITVKEAFLNGIRDPALVFVGPESSMPPSPDPFTIRFAIDLEERNSAQQLKFLNAALVLRGNNTDSTFKLDDDQVSLEPPCVDGERPWARVTEEGDYSTDRFEGSRFILENVEFLEDNTTIREDLRRFPDRGVLRLETRVNSEEAEVRAPMDLIGFQVGQPPGTTCNTVDAIPPQAEEICNTMAVSVTVNRVEFTFPDEFAVLTVD